MIGPEEKAYTQDLPAPEGVKGEKEEKIVTEAELKALAHLPMLTVFYLSLQRQVSSTPVTPLELSAYLGVEVKVAEGLLKFLHGRGIIHPFRQGMPAYTLSQDLNAISAKDMMEMLGEFRDLTKSQGGELSVDDQKESNQKYRKIYSELASEILQLFGEDSANQLPL